MHEDLHSVIHGRFEAILSLLASWVNVNSYTENVEGGRIVGEMIAKEFSSIAGLSARSIASDRFAPHWVFETERAKSESPIVLVGHLDTVFPQNTFEGFRLEGAIARGPGVLDMKGGLVVIAEALRALATMNQLQDLALRVLIVSDEEVGSPEGRPLIQREAKGARSALVFEAGRKKDAVIVARKGTGGMKIVMRGRAAHAGNAHKEGANAIWALAKLIDAAQGMTDYARGITVNVGKVSGGQGKNTVPDYAEALVDFRYIDVASGNDVEQRLRQAALDAALAVTGVTATVEGGIARIPLERTEANLALFRAYADCAMAVGLGGEEAPLLGGGSDASSTAAIGIPSIDGLGPRGTGFHTHDELIEIETLPKKAEALAQFLLLKYPI